MKKLMAIIIVKTSMGIDTNISIIEYGFFV